MSFSPDKIAPLTKLIKESCVLYSTSLNETDSFIFFFYPKNSQKLEKLFEYFEGGINFALEKEDEVNFKCKISNSPEILMEKVSEERRELMEEFCEKCFNDFIFLLNTNVKKKKEFYLCSLDEPEFKNENYNIVAVLFLRYSEFPDVSTLRLGDLKEPMTDEELFSIFKDKLTTDDKAATSEKSYRLSSKFLSTSTRNQREKRRKVWGRKGREEGEGER